MAHPLKKVDPEIDAPDQFDEDDFEEMTPEEEAELQARLEKSFAAEARGEVFDAADVLAELDRETARLRTTRR